MYVPPGMTEGVVLDAIEKAVNALAPSFSFGIYEVEDIRQEGRRWAIEALPRYDGVRPLENFIYSHVKNRLINLKRNKLRRTDAPCNVCHRAVGNVTDHEGGQFCPSYLAWRARNQAKSSLMQPLDLDSVPEDRRQVRHCESDVVESANLAEVLALIDDQLDVELRPFYLQMRAGENVPKHRRLEVQAAVKEILEGHLDV